jgi:hypothetical protein
VKVREVCSLPLSSVNAGVEVRGREACGRSWRLAALVLPLKLVLRCCHQPSPPEGATVWARDSGRAPGELCWLATSGGRGDSQNVPMGVEAAAAAADALAEPDVLATLLLRLMLRVEGTSALWSGAGAPGEDGACCCWGTAEGSCC